MLIPLGNHEDPGVKKMLLDKEATKRDLERIPFFPPTFVKSHIEYLLKNMFLNNVCNKTNALFLLILFSFIIDIVLLRAKLACTTKSSLMGWPASASYVAA